MRTSSVPKVSIITCFLNVGRLIEETIQSVLNQTYENWELWLIDDGSTDESTGIAKRYAAQLPEKIFYCEHEHHQNRGQGASRNVGIRRANGEFVAILDADDVWMPEMLAVQVKLMQTHPVAMVCQASVYWHSWNGLSKEDELVLVGAGQNKVHLPPQLMKELYPLGEGSAPSPCGLLIKKDVLLKHGAFDDAFRGIFDDQILLTKFYLNESVYITSQCYNFYRQRPGSLVSSAVDNGRYDYERKIFLKWLKRYLRKQKFRHPEITKMFRMEYKKYHIPLIRVWYHKIKSSLKQFLKKA